MLRSEALIALPIKHLHLLLPVEGNPPARNPLLKGPNATGQIICYLSWSYRVLPTSDRLPLPKRRSRLYRGGEGRDWFAEEAD